MGSGASPRFLTYSLLDDILLFSPNKVNEACRLLQAGIITNQLGPIIEYAFLRNTSLPSVRSFISDTRTEAVSKWQSSELSKRKPTCTNLEPREIEIVGNPVNNAEGLDEFWTAFWKRVDNAAGKAGFQSKTAAGLCGAAIEMADNVVQHSEDAKTGLIGYRWVPGEFEFVVADAGIGVLESLRKCPDHSQLQDHGSALMLALSGKSRYGTGSGHGNGFRQVFISLANLHGSLRFRSGDHVIEIEGDSPGVTQAKCSQRTIFKGFMASIVCRSNQK